MFKDLINTIAFCIGFGIVFTWGWAYAGCQNPHIESVLYNIVTDTKIAVISKSTDSECIEIIPVKFNDDLLVNDQIIVRHYEKKLPNSIPKYDGIKINPDWKATLEPSEIELN